MITHAIARALGALCDGPVRTNVSSANLVTLRAGGPLAVLVEPRSIAAARALWAFCQREGLPTLVRGKGSNLLVDDSGFPGVAFQLGRELAVLSARGRTIEAAAGAAQASVAHLAAERGLTGGEFLVGIPGTMGGGVCMNAGCHGTELAAVVAEVRSIMPDGELRIRKKEECAFDVRRSIFQQGRELILSARLTLASGDQEAIRTRMRQQQAQRRAAQPLQSPSCGSVFKNPPEGSAWRLIADAGFRGRSCGGAQVSEKHVNFIINRDHATARDIIRLMRAIQAGVFSRAAVALEPELVFLGDHALACLRADRR